MEFASGTRLRPALKQQKSYPDGFLMICKAHWEFGSLGLDHPMHGWLFKKSTKKPSPEIGNQDGTQWVRQHNGSAPLVPSEKPVIKTVQSYPTQSKKRKHIHDTPCITLKRISIAWQPLGWSWSNTPLSPLQCAWSWWTWLGSNHEEQNIFSDQVPWRRVLHKALTVKGIRFVPTPEYIHPMDFAC